MEATWFQVLRGRGRRLGRSSVRVGSSTEVQAPKGGSARRTML